MTAGLRDTSIRGYGVLRLVREPARFILSDRVEIKLTDIREPPRRETRDAIEGDRGMENPNDN